MLDGQNIFHPNNAGIGKKGLESGWDVDFILDSLNETGFNQKAICIPSAKSELIRVKL